MSSLKNNNREPDIPDQFKNITDFGTFYEFTIIEYAIYCKEQDIKFVWFDKNQIQILWESWESYGTIKRPDIAYNIVIQSLKDYAETVIKKETKDNE